MQEKEESHETNGSHQNFGSSNSQTNNGHQKQNPFNQKVKLYSLNSEGNWNDCGAGNLSIHKDMNPTTEVEENYLRIEGTEFNVEYLQEIFNGKYNSAKNHDNQLIINFKINDDFDCEKQGDSIITWVDREYDAELALSFLDVKYVNNTIKQINQITGGNFPKIQQDDHFQLESPTMENLEEVLNQFQQGINQQKMVQAILGNSSWLKEFGEIFDKIEDLESERELQILSSLIKELFFSYDQSMIKLLLQEENYGWLLAGLEYKHYELGYRKEEYRNFMKKGAIHSKILEIRDEEVLQRIHQNYKISFLRDSVIASYIDDNLSNQLTMLIIQNNQKIFNYFMDKQVLQEIFDNFEKKWEQTIQFLHEFISLTKFLTPNEKQNFVNNLCDFQIYEKLSRCLRVDLRQKGEKSTQLVIKVLEIFQFIFQLDPNKILDFLIEKKKYKNSCDLDLLDDFLSGDAATSENKIQKQFWDDLVELFFAYDTGIQVQIFEILKILVNPEMDQRHEIFEILTNYFLDPCLERIFDLREKKLEAEKKIQQQIQQTNENLPCFVLYLLELVGICLGEKDLALSEYLINKHFFQKIQVLFSLKDKSINLAVIKFTRQVLLTKNTSLVNNLKQIHFLDHIFKIFFENCRRNNMLKSAILEMLLKIIENEIYPLMIHIFNKFWDQIEKFQQFQAFSKLVKTLQNKGYNISQALSRSQELGLEINEQNQNEKNYLNNNLQIQIDTMKFNQNQEEEDYFNEDDADADDYLPPITTKTTKSFNIQSEIANSQKNRNNFIDEDFEIENENKESISNPRSPSKTPPQNIQINLLGINNTPLSPPHKNNNNSPNYSQSSQIIQKLNLNSNNNSNNIKRLASEISSEDEEIKNNFLLEDNNNQESETIHKKTKLE